MKYLIKLLIGVIFCTTLLSCGKKIDNPEQIDLLQTKVDSIISQGYSIDRISIYSKTFSDHGPDEVGYFNLMFIYAIPPEENIEYYANFSYSATSTNTAFHGYPNKSDNKIKDRKHYPAPNLPDAISKLGEMKKLIPENYTYENLLRIEYDKGTYKFVVELKPKSDSTTHPDVKQEKKSYVKHTTTRNRKKYGTSQEKHKTDVKRKVQNTITFGLVNGEIEIK